MGLLSWYLINPGWTDITVRLAEIVQVIDKDT